MPGQQLNASIIAQTRLTSPEEFGKILLKSEYRRFSGKPARRHSYRARRVELCRYRSLQRQACRRPDQTGDRRQALNTAKGVKDELAKMAHSSRKG